MHRSRTRTTLAGLVAAAAAVALSASVTSGPAQASGHRDRHDDSQRAIGLTGSGKLVSFAVDRPGKPRWIGTVSGLGGQTLVGIDYRVQDGALYGVGSDGGVFVVNARTARATQVSQLTVALEGTSFGVDFNPAADRLRVVSDTGQNLRHDVNAGGATIADTPLTTPPATTPTTGITAAAYTNNDLDAATATTLFDLDTALDQVVLQAPANTGTLSPTGSLGVDAHGDAGFDIVTDVRRTVARSNEGLATLKVGGRYHLFEISLLTGDAERVGAFPRRVQVVDLAVMLDR